MTLRVDGEQEGAAGERRNYIEGTTGMREANPGKAENYVQACALGDILGCQQLEGVHQFRQVQDLLHEVGEKVCRVPAKDVGKGDGGD